MNTRVILCAGHGGSDPGAVGQGTTEASEAISIVDKCVEILRRDGQLDVVQVPNELEFVDGINWVNANYPSLDDGLSVEVHKNGASSEAHGAETWYFADDGDSESLAHKLQDKLAEVLPDRGVKPDASSRFGRLGWIRDVNTWSLLVEMGFVSDGGDPIDDDADARYATALAKGILNVWGLQLGTKEAQGEEEMVADFEFVVQAYWSVLHRNYEIGQVTKEEIEGQVGRRAVDVLADMRSSKEWLTGNHYWIRGAGIQQQLTELQSQKPDARLVKAKELAKKIGEL